MLKLEAGIISFERWDRHLDYTILRNQECNRVIKKQDNEEEEAETKEFMFLKLLLHLSPFAHFAISNFIAL